MSILANFPLPTLKVAPFIISKDGKLHPLKSVVVEGGSQTPTYEEMGFDCIQFVANDGKLVIQSNNVDALSVGTNGGTGVEVKNLSTSGTTLSADKQTITLSQGGKTSSITLGSVLSAGLADGGQVNVGKDGVSYTDASGVVHNLLSLISGGLTANGVTGKLSVTKADGTTAFSVEPSAGGVYASEPGKGTVSIGGNGTDFFVEVMREVDGHRKSTSILADGNDIVTGTAVDGAPGRSTRWTSDGRLIDDEKSDSATNWSMVKPTSMDDQFVHCEVHLANGAIAQVKLPLESMEFASGPLTPTVLWTGMLNSNGPMVVDLNADATTFKKIQLIVWTGGSESDTLKDTTTGESGIMIQPSGRKVAVGDNGKAYIASIDEGASGLIKTPTQVEVTWYGNGGRGDNGFSKVIGWK